ncbi:amidohydrolase family protein [Stipitochalara longipes BDJ]|nr:amidohydrolase family protein [Stipitochalara longipes BDJ]
MTTGRAKKPRSLLLQGGTILAYDEVLDALEIVTNGSILIEGDRIKAILKSDSSLPDLSPDTEVINVEGDIISPGFMDTHRHGWLTTWRTMTPNISLIEYLQKFSEFAAINDSFTPEDVYISQLFSLWDGLNAGVTSSLDHAHHTFSPETAAAGLEASIDSGARVWWSYALHDIGEKFPIDAQMQNLRDIATNQNYQNERVLLGLAYDRVGVASGPEMTKAFALAAELALNVITLHYVGQPFNGNSLISKVDDGGFLDNPIPIVFSHASAISMEEVALLRKHNQYISITPESEHHFGHDHPRAYKVQDQSSLGVDTPFCFSSDLLTQMRIWLQATRLRLYKEVLGDWKVPANTGMTVEQVFLLATRNGGLSLRRPDIGVLKVGAKADILVFDGHSPSMAGYEDPVAAVVLHANVGDIQHVIVDGEFKKRDSKLVGVDWDRVRDTYVASARRLRDIFNAMVFPPLEEHYGKGVPFGTTTVSNVDRLRGESA